MIRERVNKFIMHPKKALFSLATPIIVAMLVQALYNIVDTIYIGRIGASAIAALTFSWPLFFIIIAINSGISTGMGALISRYLGAKNEKDAENTCMHGIYLSSSIIILLTIILFIFLKQIFSFFGAEGIVLNYSMNYFGIILLGLPFMFMTGVFNSIFSSQGDTKTPMIIQLISLLINIILDPIFIFSLKMSIKGAAIATVISMVIGAILAIIFMIKKSHLKIHFNSYHFSKKILKQISKVGAPASLAMLLMSFYVIFLNKAIITYGVEYVAAFGIVVRIENLAIMPMVALGIAMMTLTGMFYGAKRHELIKKMSKFSITMSILFGTICGSIFFLIPKFLLSIFTNDISILDPGALYLRIDAFVMPLVAINILVQKIIQGMGKGLPGLIITIIRLYVFVIPLSYLAVYIWNFDFVAIPISMLIGAVVSSSIALILLKRNLNQIK